MTPLPVTGTVADWQRIRQRVDALPGFGLENWHRSLVPIADQFVRAAAGDPDPAFWQRIYNPADAYGGDVITGWAARLYPYLRGDGTQDQPNPLLELPIDEPRELTAGPMGYDGPGVRSDSVPATLSRVIVNVNDRAGGRHQQVALHAGLVGVTQDQDGALRPVAGWHLAPAGPHIDDVIERIVRDHDTTAPDSDQFFYACADLVALYRAIGSATLFDGGWRLRPAAEQRADSGPSDRLVVTIIDLADGRSIGGVVDDSTQSLHWIAYRPGDNPADVPVYGSSLAMLLATALDNGGDISNLESGRLDQLTA